MKRSRRNTLVGGIMALGLVLAGTGYAYWTDSLNVTTKATTGDFGVKFVDLGLYGQYADETMNGAELKDKEQLSKNIGKSYGKIVTDASGKIQITVDNMYPGYAQVFRSDIVNVGDIAAKLSNIKFEAKGLDMKEKDLGNLKDMIGVAVYIQREQYQPTKTGNEDVFKLAKAIAANVPNDDRFFTVGGVDFVRLSGLEDQDIKAALENNVIKCAPSTDQRLDIFVGLAMDPDAEGRFTTGTAEKRTNNDDKLSQGKGVQLSMDLLWDQFNAGKDAGTTNILTKQNKAAK